MSSGSIADSSSNGNCNSSGSSGSGSTDAYGDKESVIRRQKRTVDQRLSHKVPTTTTTNQLRPMQQQQQSSDSGYTSQTYYNSNMVAQPRWNDRSNQIMRGMLPVEFIQSQAENEDDCVCDGTKRRSPRFNKSTMQT